MGYSTSDMAQMLGIETVTVRKYAMALEKAGYVIERNDSKNRTYSERDAMAFEQLKALRERSGMSVENSALAVATKYLEASGSVSAAIQESKSVVSIEEFKHYMEQYTEQLEERVYERVRYEMAATSEQIAELAENNKALTEQIVEYNKALTKQLDAQFQNVLSRVETLGKKKWWWLR